MTFQGVDERRNIAETIEAMNVKRGRGVLRGFSRNCPSGRGRVGRLTSGTSVRPMWQGRLGLAARAGRPCHIVALSQGRGALATSRPCHIAPLPLERGIAFAAGSLGVWELRCGMGLFTSGGRMRGAYDSSIRYLRGSRRRLPYRAR